MKPFFSLRFGAASICAAVSMGLPGIHAADYNFVGTGDWGDTTTWSPAGFPDSASDRALLNSAGGTLTLADSGGGDASFTINTLQVNVGAASTIQNVSGGTGALIFDNGATAATLLSAKTGSRITAINAGVSLNSDLNVFARSSVVLTFGGVIADGSNGSRGVTIKGTTTGNSTAISTTTFAAANTYTGGTIIEGSGETAANGGGKLRIAVDDALTTGGLLTIDGSSAGVNAQGGRLDLNGHNQTVGGLSGGAGSSAGRVTNLTAATTSTFTVNNTANHVFSGIIENGDGAVAFTKSGNGVQTLNGASTYTGVTTVNAGTLLVGAEGVGSLGNTAVTVNAGTLGGTGSTGGAVTVGDGTGSADAFLAAGDGAGSIGAFTIAGSLSLDSDAAFVFEYNGTTAVADLVGANGVTITGGLFSITNITSGVLAVNTQFTVIDNTSGGAIGGVFSNLAEGALITSGANQFQATYLGGTGNDLVLTVVPEPAATALLGLGLAATLLRRRRAS